ANGGQGAPLVPIFHKALCKILPCAIVNIGGVSNVSYIKDDNFIGFDMGPGNALIDDFCKQNFDLAFDKNGELASKGKINTVILAQWLNHSFFARPFPKSLDRNEFATFLDDISAIDKIDALATLTELTAQTIALALKEFKPANNCIYITGGGGKNKFMMDRLHELSGLEIKFVEDLGISSEFMEAYAFGYLATRAHLDLPITFPSTTNCQKPTSGGTFTRAR
ncbi:UNVERIFIED_CONTAM: hypothetical protein GTU68_013308, partial [Idotea baltica]|nr:hypothetical protein [Idotea baltica]